MKSWRVFSIASATVVGLALGACSESTEGTAPAESSPTQAEIAVHQLSDEINIGDRLRIREGELIDEGCEFASEPKSDAVKFQLLATVENTSTDSISDVLSNENFTFKDSEGLTVRQSDLATEEPACDNEHPSEFGTMNAGEKRRATVTLIAPVDAVEMTYTPAGIDGASPVNWDISEEIKNLDSSVSAPESNTPAPTTSSQATTVESIPPAEPSAPAPEPAPAPESDSVIGFTGAPGHEAPAPMDKTIASCGDPSLHQPGTTFFTDGTSGWTAQCSAQMG